MRPQPGTLVRLLGVLGSSLADYAEAFAEVARARKRAVGQTADERPRHGEEKPAGPPEETDAAAEVHELRPSGSRAGYDGELVQIQIKELNC